MFEQQRSVLSRVNTRASIRAKIFGGRLCLPESARKVFGRSSLMERAEVCEDDVSRLVYQEIKEDENGSSLVTRMEQDNEIGFGIEIGAKKNWFGVLC